MKTLAKFISKDGLPLTFIIFYIVGIALYALPFTRDLFIHITASTLVLVAFAVFYYHQQWNIKTILVLTFIFITSFLVEAIGVKTGVLFGVYAYDIGLGVKIIDVPILIGLNWVILIYGSNAILSKFTSNKALIVIGGSALMVVYDLVLELAAPLMKMWQFENNNPPFKNYLMWFLMAAVFHFAIEVFKVNTNNKPARALFIIQFFFFVVIVTHSLIYNL